MEREREEVRETGVPHSEDCGRRVYSVCVYNVCAVHIQCVSLYHGKEDGDVLVSYMICVLGILFVFCE